MNALQIVSPKPVTRIARSRLLYGVPGLILLLALVGVTSMSRGEEGAASEPAVAPAAATTGDSSGGGDEKLPASAQPNGL